MYSIYLKVDETKLELIGETELQPLLLGEHTT